MTQTSNPEVETRPIELIDLEQELNPFETDDGSNTNRHAHYITWADNPEFVARFGQMSSQSLIDTARFHGMEVIALCGYKWVPKLNPKVYPVCPRCAQIAADRILGD